MRVRKKRNARLVVCWNERVAVVERGRSDGANNGATALGAIELLLLGGADHLGHPWFAVSRERIASGLLSGAPFSFKNRWMSNHMDTGHPRK